VWNNQLKSQREGTRSSTRTELNIGQTSVEETDVDTVKSSLPNYEGVQRVTMMEALPISK